MKNRILVVAAHPDDETLGCGGTLLKHKANGDKIHWLICTTLNKSHNYYQNREKEINMATKKQSVNRSKKMIYYCNITKNIWLKKSVET